MELTIKQLPLLNSNRLILRPISIEDAEDMFLYAKHPNVGPRAGWMPHQSVEESKVIINQMILNTLNEANLGVFSIVLKENFKMIGTIGVHKVNLKYESCEIGYVLNPSYWGLGIMKEASERLITWLFEDLNFFRIECGHYDFNQQSRRVIEKLGFSFEGILRKKIVLKNGQRCDLYQYSILKPEYENKTLPWQ